MKKFKRFLKGALIVILVLAVINQISSMILSKRVALKIAEIKAQGDPVSIAEMGKVDIPDPENGATIYMQIFEEIGHPLEYVDGTLRGVAPNKPRNLDYSEFFIGKEPTPEMWVKGRRSMATYQHALDLVDEAIAKPGCKFKANWKDGIAVMLPNYATLRELSRMLKLDAQISARDGDMDKAVKRAGQIFKVSESVKEDPMLMSHLEQIAIISIGLKCIKDIEQYGQMNAVQAKYLDEILGQLDLKSNYLLAMKGERASGIRSYNVKQDNYHELVWRAHYGNSSKPPLYIYVFITLGRPLILMDELAYLDYMGRKIHDAAQPYPSDPVALPRYDAGGELPRYALISRLVVPVYARSSQQRDIAISYIRSGRAYLGLIAYKEKFGAYPKSLDELRSKLGWKVEVDPLTGKDFHYKRQGAGFLLYGVGPNLRDDGGVFRQKKATDLPSDEYDDIVWQLAK